MKFYRTILFWVFIFTSFYVSKAEKSDINNSNSSIRDSPIDNEVHQYETIEVIGVRSEESSNPFFIQVISEEAIKKFNYTDPHRLLQSTVGVHLQDEDGFGLRPNIGLRGASPHRSKKISLLEDGVLIAPAPYSSPAAYFFPNMMRTHHVEIFKSFSSIQYGPSSIGGAINFITNPIPHSHQFEMGFGYGGINKYEFSLGERKNLYGYLIEYNGMNSKGFKKLPRDGKTGFYKNDLMFKGEYHIEKNKQKIELKVSLSNEKSHETYLGLTAKDFEESSYNRYAASARDLMKWFHEQYKFQYFLTPRQNIKMNLDLYYHKFRRNWSKLNGFKNDYHLSNYLDENSPWFDPHFLNILRGEQNSILESGNDQLIIGNNNRKYYSTGGIFNTLLFLEQSESILHTLRIKLAYHQDQIKRLHTHDTFKMENGELVSLNQREPGTQNKDTAYAKTFFIEDEIDFSDFLTISAVLRLEDVKTKREFLKEKRDSIIHSYQTFVPGLGIQTIFGNTTLKFGIYRGVSLVSPGQTEEIKPEESINYDLGLFYKSYFQFQINGFYNDYRNIKGFCSFSSGCTLENVDREFNGGRASIYGIESSLQKEFQFFSFYLPIQIHYTKTKTKFLNELESQNPEWGIGSVRKGDPLPYIPEDKVSFQWGLKYKKISSSFIYNWQNFVFDQSVRNRRRTIEAYGVLDWVAQYNYSKKGRVFIRFDNLLDKNHIVSLRPFGARPGKPRSFLMGWNHVF